MKRIVAFLLVVVMIFMLGVSVFAKTGDSKEKPGEPKIIKAFVTDTGEDISAYLRLVQNDETRAIEDELTSEMLKSLLKDFYKDDLVVDSAWTIEYTGDKFPVSLKFEVPFAKNGTTLYFISKTNVGYSVASSLVEDGYVTLVFKDFWPAVFVAERADSGDNDSPKSGYDVSLVATVAMMTLAGGLFAVKRAKENV